LKEGKRHNKHQSIAQQWEKFFFASTRFFEENILTHSKGCKAKIISRISQLELGILLKNTSIERKNTRQLKQITIKKSKILPFDEIILTHNFCCWVFNILLQALSIIILLLLLFYYHHQTLNGWMDGW
jgi:hypothetical protein